MSILKALEAEYQTKAVARFKADMRVTAGSVAFALPSAIGVTAAIAKPPEAGWLTFEGVICMLGVILCVLVIASILAFFASRVISLFAELFGIDGLVLREASRHLRDDELQELAKDLALHPDESVAPLVLILRQKRFLTLDDLARHFGWGKERAAVEPLPPGVSAMLSLVPHAGKQS